MLKLSNSETFLSIGAPKLQTTTALQLSAAQPQPNDPGDINAFVAGLALRRAALNGATPSPRGDMMLAWLEQRVGGKGVEESANL